MNLRIVISGGISVQPSAMQCAIDELKATGIDESDRRWESRYLALEKKIRKLISEHISGPAENSQVTIEFSDDDPERPCRVVSVSEIEKEEKAAFKKAEKARLEAKRAADKKERQDRKDEERRAKAKLREESKNKREEPVSAVAPAPEVSVPVPVPSPAAQETVAGDEASSEDAAVA